jgi:hypothetical protein
MGVAYDAASDRYFVASAPKGGFSKDGRGYISVIDPAGRVETAKWAVGLDAPKGMRARGGRLYVADLSNIRVIDIATGRIVRTVAVAGAYNITDLAFDSFGDIYAVDPGQDIPSGALHRITSAGTVTTLVRSDRLLRPNTVEIVRDQLLVGTAVGGNALMRLDREGQLIDLRFYPPERFAPTEVRSADGIGGAVLVAPDTLAVTNKETGSIALMDVKQMPLPDPVGKLMQAAKAQGVEPTAVLTEARRRRSSAANPDRAMRRGYPTADPNVFVTHDLTSPRKVAFDSRRNRLLVVEFERGDVAFVTIGASAKPEVQSDPQGLGL